MRSNSTSKSACIAVSRLATDSACHTANGLFRVAIFNMRSRDRSGADDNQHDTADHFAHLGEVTVVLSLPGIDPGLKWYESSALDLQSSSHRCAFFRRRSWSRSCLKEGEYCTHLAFKNLRTSATCRRLISSLSSMGLKVTRKRASRLFSIPETKLVLTRALR